MHIKKQSCQIPRYENRNEERKQAGAELCQAQCLAETTARKAIH